MTDGFGSITWWGFSPSLDMQEKSIRTALSDCKLHDQQSEELNILLIGAGDCRHILHTLAHAHRHPHRKINFYVLEAHLELYARNLLLLTIALEPQTRMGLQEKTELFLEVFGNSLVREQTMTYVETMANEFIKMVTDFDYLAEKMPLIDMSLLKFKERDMLEGIFKFWRNKDRRIFDVEQCWDLRLRQYLGQRYDAIPNVFDWDYSMKLCDKGAGIVSGRLYSNWRRNGVAFEIREGTYDTPNKTLASGMVFRVDGDRSARRGYWGDILVSPYIQFGIECEDQSFFKTNNNKFVKNSQDVCEFNILSLMYELSHQQKYVPPTTEKEATPGDKPGATLTEITEEETEEEKNGETEDAKCEKQPQDKPFELLAVNDMKVYFLPLQCSPDMHKKAKFQKHFNVVYLGNSMVHLLTPELSETFSNRATLILETAKFMLELKQEQCQEFVKKIHQLAQNAGCKVAEPCDDVKDCFSRFTFSRPDS